ncbi:uncharacterized protein [Linepithema humile]|uniref:uncharacterized protein n=1 Tax=Linepithema humile TaxID=83485 RepID=UPI00351DECAC
MNMTWAYRMAYKIGRHIYDIQYVKNCMKVFKKLCPLLTLSCTIFIIAFTSYINQKICPIFFFLCMQVYLNWYSVYSISYRSNPLKIKEVQNNLFNVSVQTPKSVNSKNKFFVELGYMTYKFWHCERCQGYMYKPTQHCSLCRKCFHFRDHHCFFLGACVLRQNMGNFILFCFYTSLTCLYSLCVLGPYMYENVSHILSDTDYFNIFLNFCFPINLARLLQSRESLGVLLVTIFDLLMSILCICLVFGTWKLYSCLTGKQRYANVTGKQSLKEIFGSYGLSNIIFPYNGLIGTRDINDKYELKEV